MRYPCLLAFVLSLGALAHPTLAQDDPCDCDRVIIVTGDYHFRSLPTGVVIEGATTPTDFTDQVYGRSFIASVPSLSAGHYTIEVDLAETEFHDVSQRSMSITAGRLNLGHNLDPASDPGFAKALSLHGDLDFPGEGSGGPLTINFTSSRGGAIFNSIRIKDVQNKVVACLCATELRDQEPPDAEKIPDVAGPVLYTDPAQPQDARIDDLIHRMSLREEASQMIDNAPAIERLGVPAYDYWSECLHGVARAGNATVFPQAIGLAAMWDPALLQDAAHVIATEARAKYNDAISRDVHARYYGLTFWTPNINLFRDPRWGRGQETYGEDTFLTGRLAVAFIHGLQGDNPNYVEALACAKHFAVHSGPEPLRHTFNVEPTETDFYDNYLPHFEAAVREGHVGAVMSAYNRVYGQSATASPLLLTKILRDTWGFQGHVVSDCDAVRDIWQTHKIVSTPEEAAALAVKAGCDLNCGSQYYSLTRALKKGLLTRADINQALHHVLRARFQLGMFDPPEKVPFSQITMAEVDSPAHAALALKTAHESIVLLKNTGVLPLDRAKIKKLAVIGPNTDSVPMLMGNYNGTASSPVTILQGLRATAGPHIEVTYAYGCPPVPGFSARGGRRGGANDATPTGPDSPAFQEAVAAARDADAVIFVGGINSQLEGEEMNVTYDGFAGGDRTRIELPASQTELVKALSATGKPVIFVNCSGSAVAMPWEAANLPAILQAWYPGEAGGTAVADVLFGDYNPSGRLPITVYRATEDLPPFNDYHMANRTYRYFTGTPLFAFGHGLSYTQFNYSPVKLDHEQLAADGQVKLSVDVSNTGEHDGDEVVQVYARLDGNTDPLLPRQRLCAFQRVSIPKGQHSTVELNIPASALRHWDATKHAYVMPPGTYDLQVGAASDDIRSTGTVRVAANSP